MRFRYKIELDLRSSPEELWPLVSDTDRFNRDAQASPVELVERGKNTRRRLRHTKLGVPLEWEEEPFEWVAPHHFSVVREYTRGPIAGLGISAQLDPRDDGGTHLVYELEAWPRNLLGWFAIPIGIGQIGRRRSADVFRRYDRALQDERSPLPAPYRKLASRDQSRIEAAGERLVDTGVDSELAARLAAVIAGGDELTVARLRPYVLAETWGTDRRRTMELFLQATHEGMLELRWELLCPLCRSTVASVTSLADVGGRVHCENCGIDFVADFGRSVEVTFRPAPDLRTLPGHDFSGGGPQLTPHVVAQQLVPARTKRAVETELEPGSYRLRALSGAGFQPVAVTAGGHSQADVRLAGDGWSTSNGGVQLDEHATLTVENATAEEQLIVLERTAWSDRSATAAEMTSLQLFRDLFGEQALRPGEPVPVSELTFVFTDLRGSSRYYREVGDGAAFVRIQTHLEVLRRTIAEGEGSVVKAMGDSTMAVFAHPEAAVSTMLNAQTVLAGNPLDLKVGIHSGRCVAVDANGSIDYFGSAVNLAARLAALSSGGNLVVSDAVLTDPDVAALKLHAQPVEESAPLRGFEEEQLELWRLWP
jgi:class 3 adenylate cyclase